MLVDKDFLWNGLPAIAYEGKYIIFSSYAKKLALLSEEELNNKTVLEDLEKKHFFGRVEQDVDDRLAITLYLTENCNLKCIYCFDDCNGCLVSKRKTQQMDSNSAINFLRNAINNYELFVPNSTEKKLRIHFFGGEPTLKFEIIKNVINFLEEEKIDSIYEITTNLMCSEEILNYLISKNFSIAVSCDGIPEINDRQRPFKIESKIKPSEIIERNLKFLIKNNARIRLKVVVTNESIESMPESVKYLAKLGLSHIRLEPLLIDGRVEINNLKPVNIAKFVDYFIKSVETAEILSKKYGRRIFVSNWALRSLFCPRDYFCGVVRGNRIAIMPDGAIAKCVRNLHSYNSSPFVLKDAQSQLNIEKYRELQKISVENMPACQNCFVKYICGGCCPNENFKANSCFTTSDEYKCNIAKLLIRSLIIRLYTQSMNTV